MKKVLWPRGQCIFYTKSKRIPTFIEMKFNLKLVMIMISRGVIVISNETPTGILNKSCMK